MARHGIDWRNNVAQGARCEALQLPDDLLRLAETTVTALDMDYAGVDIIRTPDRGLQVIEVNSVPAWYGLQSVTSFSIAEALVDDLVTRKLHMHALEKH